MQHWIAAVQSWPEMIMMSEVSDLEYWWEGGWMDDNNALLNKKNTIVPYFVLE